MISISNHVFLVAGIYPQPQLSEENLEKLESVYRLDRDFAKLKRDWVVKEGMKFKKSDPKLEALASHLYESIHSSK